MVQFNMLGMDSY